LFCSDIVVCAAKKKRAGHARPFRSVLWKSYTPYMLCQEVAAFSLSLTLLMFLTPSVSSHFRKASAPCFAYTGIPSFQVARPHRTPLNFTPDSPASSRVSENSALLTPADK